MLRDILIFIRRGGTVKFVCAMCVCVGGEGASQYFCCPEWGDCIFLELTKSYKRVCTTHLQHVIEFDSGLLWLIGK